MYDMMSSSAHKLFVIENFYRFREMLFRIRWLFIELWEQMSFFAAHREHDDHLRDDWLMRLTYRKGWGNLKIPGVRDDIAR